MKTAVKQALPKAAIIGLVLIGVLGTAQPTYADTYFSFGAYSGSAWRWHHWHRHRRNWCHWHRCGFFGPHFCHRFWHHGYRDFFGYWHRGYWVRWCD